MALRRIFVDRIVGSEAAVGGRAAHHLARVARLRPGEAVEVSDQRTAFRAVTVACSPTEVTFRIGEALPAIRPPRLDVALAVIKFSRFEWALEKLTELGVRSVTPLVAARCDPRLVRAAPKRLDRWRRIVFEAAQQSRRLAAPTVGSPQGIDLTIRESGSERRILAQPGTDAVANVCGPGAATLLVGPEGGWTAEEASLAQDHGFLATSLGEGILRSETAAVALTAVIASREYARSEQ